MVPFTRSRRLSDDANAAQIADTVVSTFQGIEFALAPIIGRQGIDALFKRSLDLTAALYPWLVAPQTDGGAAMDLEALKLVLTKQPSAAAAAAGGALVQKFQELLVGLIGPSLTERLLLSVWNPP